MEEGNAKLDIKNADRYTPCRLAKILEHKEITAYLEQQEKERSTLKS